MKGKFWFLLFFEKVKRAETGSTIAAPAFSYFFKKYLEIHPEIPRTFTKPNNVYSGEFMGKEELYTDISPLPDIDSQIIIDQTSPDGNSMEF